MVMDDMLHKRYDEVVYLTAHNAYEYLQPTPAQSSPQIQSGPILTQLTQGVRALMLDIEHYQDQIYLCHKVCGGYAIPLTPVLNTICEFLDSDENAVITIIFESRVCTDEARQLLDQAFTRVRHRIFDPRQTYTADVDTQGDWPTDNVQPIGLRSVEVDGWPTLGWMKMHGKDLVIFTERTDSKDGLPNIWDYAVENHWGFLSLLHWTWTSPRIESKPLSDDHRSLLILNHFPGGFLTQIFGRQLVQRAYWWINHRRYLTKHLAAFRLKSNNRLPTFIAVDYYNIGAALELVEGLIQTPHGVHLLG